MSTADNQILRLSIQSRLDLLPGTTSFVRGVATRLGLADKDANRLELVVEEACVNVIEHAFEGETGSYDIVVTRRPGQIIVGVEDRGLPFDFKKYQGEEQSGLGMVLMKAFADEVRFLNLGRNGKRVELVKNLPDMDIDNCIRESEAKAASTAISEADITVRLMRPEESPSLARCAYRCYGYTYSTDNFYFPERVRELIESGLMVSVVAVIPGNEIIGHLAVVKESPDALVGETGQAIVDPRFRGHGLLNKMGRFLGAHNRETCMFGTYAEAVTVHTYSQKSAITRGAAETGILLGFTPATMFFKDIEGGKGQKRRAVVLLYTRLNEEPFRDIFVPPHHAGILRRIYERSNMLRNIVTGDVPELPERSQVDVKVQTEASRAFLRVIEYGQDLEALIKFRLRELCTRRVDCIYLDLPLAHPAVQRYCASMEMLGFFFGGVLPELYDGDALRLQYINNAELELRDIHLATDFSRELFQYVLKNAGLS